MNIAFVIHQFPKLSETFILNQITGLIDLGHEVDIFANSNPDEENVHHEIEAYRLLKRTRYFHNPGQKWARTTRAILLLLRNFHKDPRKILRSFMIAKRFKLRPLSAWQYVIPFLGRNYDIIHCHFGGNGYIGTFLKEIGIGGRVLISFHGADISRRFRQEEASAYDLVFEKADLITSNSDYTKKKLTKLGCNPEKIKKLSMGVDLRELSFSERRLAAGDRIRILTVARLVEKKGLEYSIRAVAKLIKSQPGIQYRIVGDGPLRDGLKILISDLGVSEQIELLGWRNTDEVRELYEKAHLFTLASVTAEDGDEEGQGLVLQEAQAMGLPVVITNHDGFPEGMLDSVSGFLVPERDADALAEKLDYLIQHPETWPDMGRAGREFVEEHYNIKKLNHRLVEIYQSLLANK